MFRKACFFSYSPPARWGSLDFIRVTFLLPSFLPCLLPSPNSEVQIAVGTAGPQLQTPDRSGHCRTSTAPQPRTPDRSGHRQTSTTSSRCQWALPDLNRHWDLALAVEVRQCPCQRECQNRCQIECQNRMSERLSDRMPERKPEWMPE